MPKNSGEFRSPFEIRNVESENHTIYAGNSPLMSPFPTPSTPASPSPIYQDTVISNSQSGDDIVQLSISVVDTGIGIPPEDLPEFLNLLRW